MHNKIIKVLIVEDSPVMCKVLTHILESDPNIIVAGVAHNGKQAVEMVAKIKPDVITMDIEMPVMTGFEAIKIIMAYCPTPILVITASAFKLGMDKVFKSIAFGALEVIDKSELDFNYKSQKAVELINKVKMISNIKVLHHPLAKIESKKILKSEPESFNNSSKINYLVAIVSSTGGPQALVNVLRKFPKNFPCSIVIVQHITTGFDSGLAEWLDEICQINVKLGENSEKLKPGTAYIAPCDMQMRVTENETIRIADEGAFGGHNPSGSILLESAANVYGKKCTAVILTGMGCDGAAGMQKVKECGGYTIAQDEESCVVYGMPKAAVEMGAINKVVGLDDIASEILKKLHGITDN